MHTLAQMATSRTGGISGNQVLQDASLHARVRGVGREPIDWTYDAMMQI
jgi:hypothetical protein